MTKRGQFLDIQYTLEYQYNVSYLYLTAVNMAASLLYSAFLFPISLSRLRQNRMS